VSEWLVSHIAHSHMGRAQRVMALHFHSNLQSSFSLISFIISVFHMSVSAINPPTSS
jgi:hypothetical protein